MRYLQLLIIFVAFKISLSKIIFNNREISVKKPIVPTQNEIGYSRNRKGRITNGYVSETGSRFLPFFTLLYVRRNATEYNMCGGSIISEKFILSAGHCFESCIEVFILAGFNNSQIDSFTFFDQVPSSSVAMHTAYNSTTIANDIALIRLSKAVTYGLLLQKIKLPTLLSNFLNKTGVVSGFGTYSDINSVTSNVLRYTFVTATNGTTCQISYGSTFFGTDRQLCIDGKGGHSSCSGDSGGSLGILENNEMTLAGIVSYGSAKGCELGNPEVYTKVSSYLSWIQNKTGI